METTCISCRVIRMTDGNIVWFCMASVLPMVQAVHISVLLNEWWLLDVSYFLIEYKSLFQMNMSTTDNTENCNGLFTVDLLRTIHVYDTIPSTPGTYLSCITRRSLCCMRGACFDRIYRHEHESGIRKEISLLFRLLFFEEHPRHFCVLSTSVAIVLLKVRRYKVCRSQTSACYLFVSKKQGRNAIICVKLYMYMSLI